MDNNDEPQEAHKGRVIAGLIIIAAGVMLLADRIGISGIHLSGRYWPLLLMAFGFVRLFDSPIRRNGKRRSRWTGVWFIYLGLWVYGLVIDLTGRANFMPLNGADNWLHLGLGVLMMLLGVTLAGQHDPTKRRGRAKVRT